MTSRSSYIQNGEKEPLYTPVFEHNNPDERSVPGIVHGLTAFTAAVFIVGEMAGSGVLALPMLDGLGLSSYVFSAFYQEYVALLWENVGSFYGEISGNTKVMFVILILLWAFILTDGWENMPSSFASMPP